MFGLFITVAAIVGSRVTIGWRRGRMTIAWGGSRVTISRGRRRVPMPMGKGETMSMGRSMVKRGSMMDGSMKYLGFSRHKGEEGQDSECLKKYEVWLKGLMENCNSWSFVTLYA